MPPSSFDLGESKSTLTMGEYATSLNEEDVNYPNAWSRTRYILMTLLSSMTFDVLKLVVIQGIFT
jgi:hypothetical protein